MRRFLALPAGLVVLPLAEFGARAAGAAAVGFEGGALPAYFAYDGVYTLALRTMVSEPHARARRPRCDCDRV